MNAPAATAPSQSTKAILWKIDPAHSAAHFSVRHLMISNVRGEFTKVSGTARSTDLSRELLRGSHDRRGLDQFARIAA